MNSTLSPARIEAALRCYDRVGRSWPGTESAEIAEHAVTLALSEDRPEKDPGLLYVDVLRDAERSVYRAAASRRRVESEIAYLSAAGVRTGSAGPSVDPDTPEDHALANELRSIVRDRATALGGVAPRVLAGPLIGETECETASAASVSRSTVTRLRRDLRAAATNAGYDPASL